MDNLKKKAITGVLWTFAQQFSVQLINFIVQIVLARILMPEDFGLIAMLTVFINLGQLLMDGGMTSSLIRMKNPDQTDYSTVFVTNFIVSLLMYFIIYTISPFVSDFYSQPLLKNVLRVYAISFVIRALVAVHVTKLTKEMNFKTQMKLQIPSTIFGATVGIYLAYRGLGVWSLVWLNLSQTIIFTIQNWIFIKWRPSFEFNKRRFKYHFNFGYKLTLSGVLDTIYNDAYRIVIGKFYSPTSVGYFNQAETMRLFPVKQIATAMGKVTYPMFSNIKDDHGLKNAYKQTMILVLLLVVPIMMILIVVGEELFLVIFGEKWLPAVPYFQVLAFASVIRPITTYNLNILKVKGRTDLFLKLEVYKKIIGILAIAISLPYGIMTLVVSYTVVYYLMNFLNMIISGKLISYSIFEQVKDTYKVFLIGIVCMVVTYFLKSTTIISMMSDFFKIAVLTFIFIVFYLALVLIMDREVRFILQGIFKK